MSESAPSSALRTGIARWQQKHGIADGDPALACLELFDLYLASLRQRAPDTPPLRYEEFRSTMELLDQRSKGFAKHAAELIYELRQATQTQQQLRRINLLMVSLTTLAAFVTGLLTGIFLC